MKDPREFKVDSDVPVPDSRYREYRRYPWRSMKKGDSFFVPAGDRGAGGTQSGILQTARVGRHPFKITTRCVRESGVDGVRVWRIT